MAARIPQADLRRMHDRLAALRFDPPKQRAYATELLETAAPSEVLPQILAALGPPFDASIRPYLLRRYESIHVNGRKLDPGGALRTAILSALSNVSTAEDIGLFLDASHHRERTMQEPNGPANLRAAGLLGLQSLDPTAAKIEAIRLLIDAVGTLEMTGEPALTAIRVLFALGNDMVILHYALVGEGNAEVLGEAFRSLANLPAFTVESLIECYGHGPDDIVVAGLCDLAVATATPACIEYIERMLASDRYDLAGYIAMAIAALRQPSWLDRLYTAAGRETNRSRLVVFIRALRAIHGDPKARTTLAAAEDRLAALRATLASGIDPLTGEEYTDADWEIDA